jgi:hypothetical protein
VKCGSTRLGIDLENLEKDIQYRYGLLKVWRYRGMNVRGIKKEDGFF